MGRPSEVTGFPRELTFAVSKSGGAAMVVASRAAVRLNGQCDLDKKSPRLSSPYLRTLGSEGSKRLPSSVARKGLFYRFWGGLAARTQN